MWRKARSAMNCRLARRNYSAMVILDKTNGVSRETTEVCVRKCREHSRNPLVTEPNQNIQLDSQKVTTGGSQKAPDIHTNSSVLILDPETLPTYENI
jgi:hypothetical protein